MRGNGWHKGSSITCKHLPVPVELSRVVVANAAEVRVEYRASERLKLSMEVLYVAALRTPSLALLYTTPPRHHHIPSNPTHWH